MHTADGDTFFSPKARSSDTLRLSITPLKRYVTEHASMIKWEGEDLV